MRKNQMMSSTKEIIVEIASLYIGIRVRQKICSTVYPVADPAAG